jgi:hypothetical protein
MTELMNLLSKYFGIESSVLYAAIESTEHVNGDDHDRNHNESTEHVNGVDDDRNHNESTEHVNGVDDDRNHNESTEHVNGVDDHGVSNQTGYSQISDDDDQYRFQLGDNSYADGDLVDATDAIVSKFELGRRGWKLDSIDNDESLSVQIYNGEAYIIETEIERSGNVEFNIYQDLDGDQIWTEVVEGEIYSSNIVAGDIDLVGLVNAGVIDPAMFLY